MIFTNLIKTNLRTTQFGKDIEYYQRIDSTNSEAWELIKENKASNGMIVITDNQYEGKGRNNNKWFMSPSKGLAMSIILTNPFPVKTAKLIPLAAGVAAAKMLENRGAIPKLKWPNDIFIGNKKCGGILCETKMSNNQVKSMVIGFGININENENDLPKEIINSSTSLSIETGHSNQRELVCAILITYFENLLMDIDSVRKNWQNYCYHLDQPISFSHDNLSYEGIFKGIDKNGHAIIKIGNNLKNFPSIIIE
ncbi:MAG: biotin--[acetyl-CoA-carboxylase] ligase [Candidatus Marinimicrobia bacterium]|nr:biotin--[acetyl-CoA-carboxylase] ligase [Candidatus Neomarinimicrobiota bacterium]